MKETTHTAGGLEADQLITVDEAARRLSISKARCYELIRREMLPAVALGRQRRISLKALKRFIRKGGTRPR